MKGSEGCIMLPDCLKTEKAARAWMRMACQEYNLEIEPRFYEIVEKMIWGIDDRLDACYLSTFIYCNEFMITPEFERLDKQHFSDPGKTIEEWTKVISSLRENYGGNVLIPAKQL